MSELNIKFNVINRVICILQEKKRSTSKNKCNEGAVASLFH